MRWCVHLSGEHGEGVESGLRFDAIVAEFTDKLRSNGFQAQASRCEVVDSMVLTVPGQPAEGIESREWFEGVVEDDDVVWEDVGEYESPVEASGEGEVEPGEGDVVAELTLADIRKRIKEEKAATGGNKILSQKELAERIGVTVYKIKRALR